MIEINLNIIFHRHSLVHFIVTCMAQVSIYIAIYTGMYECMHVCMYLCKYVCMYVSTKTDTYLRMNPGLILHNVYKDTGTFIRDYQRVSFTRLRLSAHRLRVETGRWTRTPREAQMCRVKYKMKNMLYSNARLPKTLETPKHAQTLRVTNGIISSLQMHQYYVK